MKKFLSVVFVFVMLANTMAVSAWTPDYADIHNNPVFDVIGKITEVDAAEGKIVHEYIQSPEEEASYYSDVVPEAYNYYRYSIYDNGLCTKSLILTSERVLYDSLQFATNDYPAYDNDVKSNEYTLAEDNIEDNRKYKITVNDDGSITKELLFIEEFVQPQTDAYDDYGSYNIYKVTGDSKELFFEDPVPASEYYNLGYEKEGYNDGLIRTKEDGITVFNDIDGISRYVDIQAIGLTYYLNLGYVMEVSNNINEIIYDETAYQRNYTDIRNLYTDEMYSFENCEIRGFLDNGYGIMYTRPVGNEEVGYLIKLKKPAIVTVHLDGKKIKFDQLPVIENGRTLVPLRAIFDALGATVLWDGDTSTVTATKGDTEVKLTIDSTTATKNGEVLTLDVPAKLVGGRTLVPARFVADCFNVDVDWNGALSQVILTSK